MCEENHFNHRPNRNRVVIKSHAEGKFSGRERHTFLDTLLAGSVFQREGGIVADRECCVRTFLTSEKREKKTLARSKK